MSKGNKSGCEGEVKYNKPKSGRHIVAHKRKNAAQDKNHKILEAAVTTKNSHEALNDEGREKDLK